MDSRYAIPLVTHIIIAVFGLATSLSLWACALGLRDSNSRSRHKKGMGESLSGSEK